MLGDSFRRRQPRRRSAVPPVEPDETVEAVPRKRRGHPDRWKPLWIGLPLALLLPFLIGYLFAVRVMFPPTPVSGMGIPVPDLAGRSAAEAQRDLVLAGLGPLETTDLPHPSAPEGQIIAQSPLPGQQLRGGAGVRVALSTGRPRGVVPDVTGFGADRAESLLRGAGFDVTRATQESSVGEGRVIRTEPQPGTRIALPAPITLVVAVAPPPLLPDTVAIDTLAAPPPRR